jgi:hypothetical protein
VGRGTKWGWPGTIVESANKVKTAITNPPRIFEQYDGIDGSSVKQITTRALVRGCIAAATERRSIAENSERTHK